MKAIIKTITLLLILFLVSCNEEINRPLFDDKEDGQYVRFALILDNNGIPIEGELGTSEQYTNTYHHQIFDSISIPVCLTSTSLTETVKVSYSKESFGDDANILSFEPDSILTFGPGNYYDTIDISFNKRWYSDIKDSIILELTKVSHPDISIGYPYNDSINDKLTIHLDEIKLPMTISNSKYTVKNPFKKDTFDTYIVFKNGYFQEEIEGKELFKEVENNMDYRLIQHPLKSKDSIKYSFILNSPIEDKYKDYSCKLEMESIRGYIPWGNTDITVNYVGLEKNSYTLSDSEIEIEGHQNENITFDLQLSSPINQNVIDDLKNSELIRATREDFEYTLSQESFSIGDSIITYTLELNESLIDSTINEYINSFELIEIEGFTTYGTSEIIIIKKRFHIKTTLNPAKHFYNSNYPNEYQQLWHYYWIYSGTVCKWWESFQLCYPLEVDENDPNGIKHSNGKYYHAFKFGFNSPNVGRTTNSFGLKRLYDNEYTDADKSPGFNIPEALELFPKNGTSNTEGDVIVIEQDIEISSENEKIYIIGIAGEGKYYYDEGSYEVYRDSIYTIELQLRLTSKKLYGGTFVVNYMFKNRDMDKSDKPSYTFDTCNPIIDLNTIK